jgi:hypothetical protein
MNADCFQLAFIWSADTFTTNFIFEMITLWVPACGQASVHWICCISFVHCTLPAVALNLCYKSGACNPRGSRIMCLRWVIKLDMPLVHLYPIPLPDNFCSSNLWTVLECGSIPSYCIHNLSSYCQRHILSKVVVNFLENSCNGQLINVLK